MHIERLEVSDVRNLVCVQLEQLNQVNIFFGDNGSGKTSLLESLHLLGLGRSFRTRAIKSVIQHEKEQSVVFCSAYKPDSGTRTPVGVSRSRKNPPEVRINGKTADSLAELAKLFPLQLINSNAFDLLEGSPAIRRQFLDWGVFHVEHQFYSAWKNARKCLAHRNSLLRRGKIQTDELNAWTAELVSFSDLVDSARKEYVERFEAVLSPVLGEISDIQGINIDYFRGWSKVSSLQSLLSDALDRDIMQGFTSLGPHRADLKITKDGIPASEWLSRGQEKLLICALKLAQAILFEKITGDHCIFLIDDLPSEFDSEHLGKVCRLLEDLECQIFITCIDPSELQSKWRLDQRISWFHVEHGEIKAVKQPIWSDK